MDEVSLSKRKILDSDFFNMRRYEAGASKDHGKSGRKPAVSFGGFAQEYLLCQRNMSVGTSKYTDALNRHQQLDRR